MGKKGSQLIERKASLPQGGPSTPISRRRHWLCHTQASLRKNKAWACIFSDLQKMGPDSSSVTSLLHPS